MNKCINLCSSISHFIAYLQSENINAPFVEVSHPNARWYIFLILARNYSNKLGYFSWKSYYRTSTSIYKTEHLQLIKFLSLFGFSVLPIKVLVINQRMSGTIYYVGQIIWTKSFKAVSWICLTFQICHGSCYESYPITFLNLFK